MSTKVISLTDAGVRFKMKRRARRKLSAPTLGVRKDTRYWGLRNVDLHVEPGEIVGVVGLNGSGKTTLLRLISGIFLPDEGSATTLGRIAPLLSPTAGLRARLTGWENIELSLVLLGTTAEQARSLTESVGDFSGLGDFLDAPVRTYSEGMKARLGFAAAVLCEPDVLVLDEVIDVGDKDFRSKSRKEIKDLHERGVTIVVASHELDDLVDLCTRAVHVKSGSLVDDGDPRDVITSYRNTTAPVGSGDHLDG